jgi:glycosyltransferase involved in cell wall biosynthesis
MEATVGAGERSPSAPLDVLILYAQPSFWSMGEGRGAVIFTRLPQAMARRGHRVRISLPGGPQDPEREIYHGFELRRTPGGRSFVPDPEAPAPLRLGRRLACWLRYQRWALAAGERLVREARPDVVLGMGYYEAPAARRLAVRHGLPNVTRLFGNALSLQLRRGLRFYANFPEVIALKTPADLIILNDDGADGEQVARRLRVPRERFRHLRNGVDFRLFTPGPPVAAIRSRLGLDPDQPVLMTVTRLASEKKLERAIAVLQGLSASHPRAVLVLLGDGPERERLQSAARASGLEGRVLFPGPVVQGELPDWYRSADIVLSLLDRTNGANPVFEAMACGRVVVALDAGTTRSVVEDGRTGIVLPRDDLPRLGAILGELLHDGERMERIGKEACRTIPSLVLPLEDRLDLEVDLLEEAVRTGRERLGKGGG